MNSCRHFFTRLRFPGNFELKRNFWIEKCSRRKIRKAVEAVRVICWFLGIGNGLSAFFTHLVARPFDGVHVSDRQQLCAEDHGLRSAHAAEWGESASTQWVRHGPGLWDAAVARTGTSASDHATGRDSSRSDEEYLPSLLRDSFLKILIELCHNYSSVYISHRKTSFLTQKSIRDYSGLPEVFLEKILRACKTYEREVADVHSICSNMFENDKNFASKTVLKSNTEQHSMTEFYIENFTLELWSWV